jgi:hypothetical protein
VDALVLLRRAVQGYIEGNGQRMLPVEARLSVEPGEDSVVRLAGADGTFAMPTSERQFRRRMQDVRWAHSVTLRLAP